MLVVIRGAGDLATGIALRLHRAGYQIVMTDLPAPTSIRRTVCFSEAIRLGEMTVEDISARKAETPEEALTLAQSGVVAVLADPAGACIPTLRPGAVVDAILAKKNLGTALTDAPVVIGVGPGFTVGTDCHAAVETCGATRWAGRCTPAVLCPTPASPASSADAAASGSSGPRRTAFLSRAWRSDSWFRREKLPPR